MAATMEFEPVKYPYEGEYAENDSRMVPSQDDMEHLGNVGRPAYPAHDTHELHASAPVVPSDLRAVAAPYPAYGKLQGMQRLERGHTLMGHHLPVTRKRSATWLASQTRWLTKACFLPHLSWQPASYTALYIPNFRQPLNGSSRFGTGKDFVYYIRSLSVTLGRKTSHTDEVDVDLGKSKSVSRRCVPVGQDGWVVQRTALKLLAHLSHAVELNCYLLSGTYASTTILSRGTLS